MLFDDTQDLRYPSLVFVHDDTKVLELGPFKTLLDRCRLVEEVRDLPLWDEEELFDRSRVGSIREFELVKEEVEPSSTSTNSGESKMVTAPVDVREVVPAVTAGWPAGDGHTGERRLHGPVTRVELVLDEDLATRSVLPRQDLEIRQTGLKSYKVQR